MTTAPRPARPARAVLATALLAAIALGACSAGAPETRKPPGSTAPSASSGPSDSAGNGPGGHGPAGSAELVVPKPGQLDVHPIPADALVARVDGHRVVVTVSYTSGVEPCSVLDSIDVQRGAGTFAITLRQGHAPGQLVCIMIARLMKTQVDLGELEPGTYTISDGTGGAASIQVVVD